MAAADGARPAAIDAAPQLDAAAVKLILDWNRAGYVEHIGVAHAALRKLWGRLAARPHSFRPLAPPRLVARPAPPPLRKRLPDMSQTLALPLLPRTARSGSIRATCP